VVAVQRKISSFNGCEIGFGKGDARRWVRIASGVRAWQVL
jgi:hypothetical protein